MRSQEAVGSEAIGVSATDPDSNWGTKGGPARFSYFDNYLIDNDYVAAVNFGTAEERSDFEIWDAGQTRRRLLEAGGLEIELPRLKPRIAAKLSKYRLTFEQGKTSSQLTLADRARLVRWAADAEAAIVPAAERLGL